MTGKQGKLIFNARIDKSSRRRSSPSKQPKKISVFTSCENSKREWVMDLATLDNTSQRFQIPIFNRFAIISVNIWESSSFKRLGSYKINLATMRDNEEREENVVFGSRILSLKTYFVPSLLGREWTNLVNITKFLMDFEKPTVMDMFLDSVPVPKAKSIAQHLLLVAKNHSQSIALVNHSIKYEVANTDSPELLFRSNTLAPSLLNEFVIQHGREYIQSILPPLIHKIRKSNLCFELNGHRPKKIPLEDTMENVLKVTTSILNKIVNTVEELPSEIVHVIALAEKEVSAKFSDKIKKGHVVSVIIFLRWICPALVSPVEFDLVEICSPDLRAKLLVIAKLIQNVANGTPFNKDTKYQVLNSYIETTLPLIGDYSSSILERAKIKLRKNSPNIRPERRPYQELVSYIQTNLSIHLISKKSQQPLVIELEEYDKLCTELDANTLKSLMTLDLKEWGKTEFHTWLKAIGLGSLIPIFDKAEIKMQELINLSNEELQDFGVKKLGHRKKLDREKKKLVENSIADPRCWGKDQVSQWLTSIGLGIYSKKFTKRNITGLDLLSLTREGIERLGVPKLGHRKKIVREISRLLEQSSKSTSGPTLVPPSPRFSSQTISL